jgi:MFS family permease
VPAERTAVLLGGLVALTILGSSAVAVALPTVREEFGLDVGGAAWVLAVFSLGISVATAVFGRVADVAGLRTPLRVGVVVFAAGSLLAAAAPTFPLLLAGRVLQGIGAGAVPVLVTGIIVASLEGAARVRALGTLLAVVALVSGSGPLLGGALTAAGGWRLVVGLPAVALLLLPPIDRIAPTEREDLGAGVDATGAALVAVAVIGLVLLLQSPSTGAGPALVAGAAAAVLAAAAALARHVRRRPGGFLPVVVLADRPLLLLAAVGFGILAGYLALLLALPQILSDAGRSDPLAIGLTMLPAAAAGAVASRLAGRAAARLGRHRVITALAAAPIAGLLVAAAGAPRPVPLVAGFALAAVGFAAGQAVLTDTVTALVPDHVRGVAIGLYNLVFFTGGAVGSAAVGGLSGLVGLPGALAVLAVVPGLSLLAALAAGRLAARAP